MAKRAFLGQKFFSSWQFSYLLFLVPGKGQSSSWQNKKLRTLNYSGLYGLAKVGPGLWAYLMQAQY